MRRLCYPCSLSSTRNGLASALCRVVWILAGLCLVLTLIMINVIAYSGYAVLRDVLHVAKKVSNSKNTMDTLTDLSAARKVIHKLKQGGLVSLQGETVERLYMVSHPLPPDEKNNGSISFFGIDVSHSKESTYIYRRILSRRSFPYAHLIIDIGANDGLLSSNSFNFIQWGWDAILVEPQPSQIRLAKENTKRYRDPYNDRKQVVKFVQSVIADEDGMVDLVISDDPVNMESHVASIDKNKAKGRVIQVHSMTVKNFTTMYKVPLYFGILSIDAEGVGDKILHGFMELRFRPAYVIYEHLHNHESASATTTYMELLGYKQMTFRGWNHIYEYRR